MEPEPQFFDYDDDFDDSEAVEAYVAEVKAAAEAFGVEPPE